MLRQLTQSAGEGVGMAIEKLKAYFSSDLGQQKLESIAQAMERVLNVILDNLDPIMDGVITAINGVASAIEFLITHFDQVVGGLKLIAGAWAGLKALNIVSSIIGLVTNIGTLIGSIGGIGTAFSAVATFATGPIGMIAMAVLALAPLVIANWDSIKEFGIAAWEGIKSAWNAAGEFFGNVRQAISSKFQDIASWFGNVFSQARSAVQSAWSNVTSFFSTVRQNIINVFQSIPSVFTTIGSNIMNGLKNGIAAAVGGVVDTVRGVASRIANAVSNFFHIGSPSRLFAEYGQYLDEGLAVGISGNADQPISALQRASAELAETATASMGGIGGSVRTMAAPVMAEPGNANADPQMISMISELLARLEKFGVYIDSQTLIGYVAPGIDSQLGLSTWRDGREVFA